MSAKAPSQTSHQLLIAEDSTELCKVIKLKLERRGYAVEEVREGREVLSRAQSGAHHLLLLDYRLPDLNGAEVVDALRAGGLRLPFLVMTGEGDQATAVKMMKKGALDYLVKDGNFLDNLEPAVERALHRVDTERRLREAEEALRLSEERFQLAVAGSHDGIWDCTRGEKDVFWWSPQVYELLGYAPGEVEIDISFFRGRMDHEQQEVVVEAYRRHREHGAPFEVEFRMRKKGGNPAWFRVRGQTITDEEGRPKRMAGSFEEITQRKESEEHRRLLEAQLRQAQKMETIGTLAGGVAHDFNNILAAIYGYVALAERRVGPDHPALEDLEGIMQSAERARDLVQQILVFSRRTDSELQPLMAKPIFKESLRLM